MYISQNLLTYKLYHFFLGHDLFIFVKCHVNDSIWHGFFDLRNKKFTKLFEKEKKFELLELYECDARLTYFKNLQLVDNYN